MVDQDAWTLSFGQFGKFVVMCGSYENALLRPPSRQFGGATVVRQGGFVNLF